MSWDRLNKVFVSWLVVRELSRVSVVVDRVRVLKVLRIVQVVGRQVLVVGWKLLLVGECHVVAAEADVQRAVADVVEESVVEIQRWMWLVHVMNWWTMIEVRRMRKDWTFNGMREMRIWRQWTLEMRSMWTLKVVRWTLEMMWRTLEVRRTMVIAFEWDVMRGRWIAMEMLMVVSMQCAFLGGEETANFADNVFVRRYVEIDKRLNKFLSVLALRDLE